MAERKPGLAMGKAALSFKICNLLSAPLFSLGMVHDEAGLGLCVYRRP